MSGEQTTTTIPTTTGHEKKPHHHWWQDVPRRLSLTRNRSNSESSEGGQSPMSSSPNGTTEAARPRRFSEASGLHGESSAQLRERWNRNYNIPPECFVPPWI